MSIFSALLHGRLTGSGALFPGGDPNNPLSEAAKAAAQAAATAAAQSAQQSATAAVQAGVNAASPGAVIVTKDMQNIVLIVVVLALVYYFTRKK